MYCDCKKYFLWPKDFTQSIIKRLSVIELNCISIRNPSPAESTKTLVNEGSVPEINIVPGHHFASNLGDFAERFEKCYSLTYRAIDISHFMFTRPLKYVGFDSCSDNSFLQIFFINRMILAIMSVTDREQPALASRELVGEPTWQCPHSRCHQVVCIVMMMWRLFGKEWWGWLWSW